MAPFTVATTAKLPSTLRVQASNPTVVKSLSRLSRETLITLVLDWLDERTLPNALPHLAVRREFEDEEEEDDDDSDDLYPPCRSIPELRQLYLDMHQLKGSKRDVVARITEGDWRHGLTLHQLAMLDFWYLDEHPGSQKWTAYQILPLRQPSKDAEEEERLKVDKKSLKTPRFHPSAFLQKLQDQVLPDMKAHYLFHRPKGFAGFLLRIFTIDSPYNSDLALSIPSNSGVGATFDSSRTIYLAIPDGSSSLFITKLQANGPSSTGEAQSLRTLIVDVVPKALSRPRERYKLERTSLASKNLNALLDKLGPSRGNSAGGGWSVYADELNKMSPLDTVMPPPPLTGDVLPLRPGQKRPMPGREESAAKRRKVVAKARFGRSGIVTDGKGVEKVDMTLEDPFPSSGSTAEVDRDDSHGLRESEFTSRQRRTNKGVLIGNEDGEDDGEGLDSSSWTPAINMCFHGSHVFAGIRQLIEAGIIDGERMPGWMTGEEGVTTGVIRHGRIQGHKGGGT